MDILVNWTELWCLLGCSGSSARKNLPANAGDPRDWGSVPGLERSPGEGDGNTLQSSLLFLICLFLIGE